MLPWRRLLLAHTIWRTLESRDIFQYYIFLKEREVKGWYHNYRMQITFVLEQRQYLNNGVKHVELNLRKVLDNPSHAGRYV